MTSNPPAEDVRQCEVRFGSTWCARTDAKPYEAYDGGEVWLCPRHRGWLPALGRIPQRNDSCDHDPALRHWDGCTAATDKEKPMPETSTKPFTDEQELRLAALDRAINRLHADREATPDDVLDLAVKFEQYLKR